MWSNMSKYLLYRYFSLFKKCIKARKSFKKYFLPSMTAHRHMCCCASACSNWLQPDSFVSNVKQALLVHSFPSQELFGCYVQLDESTFIFDSGDVVQTKDLEGTGKLMELMVKEWASPSQLAWYKSDFNKEKNQRLRALIGDSRCGPSR